MEIFTSLFSSLLTLIQRQVLNKIFTGQKVMLETGGPQDLYRSGPEELLCDIQHLSIPCPGSALNWYWILGSRLTVPGCPTPPTFVIMAVSSLSTENYVH